MEKPIISVNGARKILGGAAKKMTDEEIKSTIETFDLFAIEVLKMSKEERPINHDSKKTLLN